MENNINDFLIKRIKSLAIFPKLGNNKILIWDLIIENEKK